MEYNIDLKPYNTFGLNCKAKEFMRLRTEEDLDLLHSVYGKQTILFLGFGANIVFANEEFSGLVAKVENSGLSIKEEDKNFCFVEVEAGVIWDNFVDWACEKGLSGVENLAGIPSSVGAAPVQNIGAYGMEVKDTIAYVTVFDLKKNKFITLKNEECNFAYRNSIFKYQEGNLLIWKVGFCLKKNFTPNINYKALEEKIKKENIVSLTPKLIAQKVREIRNEKLPHFNVLGNVGSFFKNPVIEKHQYELLKKDYKDIVAFDSGEKKKISAAWLIEQCGYKGKRIGNIGMHDKQALVMVNYGGASGKDVLHLAHQIQKNVKEKFDIDLNIEAHLI
ncbi:MAG: UDP-N-acetylmuramate dehydrogenase [Bacteroidales bacterium]|nr:UDP-N-acetylmuramate dehydrogenase [Bacteroidales bacterium]